MENVASKKITVAIFYHKDIASFRRKYWIGIVAKDGSCQDIIKLIPGKGHTAFEKAIIFMQNL